ncbi:hypothetical protein [Ramlibacter albus]|uniref:XRE family transcriptional regulator n=1 Tax=Ramlibacter albus TaxID=2079448 RepID=A0A923S317_9BURK|nr:hypothetical protein [Ramlibacter albus]MBC5766069.1 hypothetical protein [Ramlibacter albus]
MRSTVKLELNAREQNRLANVRRLIKTAGSIKAFAAKVGAALSTVSQYAGPNPRRRITENMARGWEEALGLREGELDAPPPDKVMVAASPATPRRRASDALAAHMVDLSRVASPATRALIEKLVAVGSKNLLPEARALQLFEEMAALER